MRSLGLWEFFFFRFVPMQSGRETNRTDASARQSRNCAETAHEATESGGTSNNIEYNSLHF